MANAQGTSDRHWAEGSLISARSISRFRWIAHGDAVDRDPTEFAPIESQFQRLLESLRQANESLAKLLLNDASLAHVYLNLSERAYGTASAHQNLRRAQLIVSNIDVRLSRLRIEPELRAAVEQARNDLMRRLEKFNQ